jgi:uncharacterized membrane protein
MRKISRISPYEVLMSAKWRIALFVSLAVNLFILGAVAAIVGTRVFGPGPGLARGFGAGGLPPPPALVMGLPPDARTRLMADLSNERQAGRALFRDVRAARADVRKAFFADPYSADAMAAALAHAREVDLKAVAAVHDATARILQTLTPDEHRALVVHLKACMNGTLAAKPPEFCRGLRGRGHMMRQWTRDDNADEPPPPPP